MSKGRIRLIEDICCEYRMSFSRMSSIYEKLVDIRVINPATEESIISKFYGEDSE